MTIYTPIQTNNDVRYALLKMEIKKPSVSVVREASDVAYDRGERVAIDEFANPVFREDCELTAEALKSAMKTASEVAVGHNFDDTCKLFFGRRSL